MLAGPLWFWKQCVHILGTLFQQFIGDWGRLPVLTGDKSQRPKATSATGSACCKGSSDMELYDQADFRCRSIEVDTNAVEGLATSIGEPQSRPLGFWIKNTLLSQELHTVQKEAPAILLDLNKNWVSEVMGHQVIVWLELPTKSWVLSAGQPSRKTECMQHNSPSHDELTL